MKFKKLDKDQILISIDRLTRFKKTKEKYLRVFTDILISNLIEPKLKKSDIENLDYNTLKNYVEVIFNSSFEEHFNDYKINKKLAEYENSVFNNDLEAQILLDNKLDYLSAINYIDSNANINLKWLKTLASDVNLDENRQLNKLKFPIKEIILVEGITEEILLPVFAQKIGYDFYENGIQIIAAGGKNQVVKMYYELAEQLKLPIFVLLDRDAEDNIKQITPKLRATDKVHLVSCGEFEDLLPKSLIIKTVNQHFKNFLAITEVEFNTVEPTVKILEEIFKTKGLHEFKKAEFAKLVKEQITGDSDISTEIADIIKEISFTNKSLDSKTCS